MPDMWMDVDTALSEVPVNIAPLVSDSDFKTIKDAVAYDADGLALYWHFVTTGGAYSVTKVTPTTSGSYDWTDQGDAGIYTIEIPASGGASINNDTEGFGWFTGVATGVLPWRGPVIGFRAAGLNNLLIDDAYSATAGLAGSNLDAKVSTRAAETGGNLAAIKAVTDALPSLEEAAEAIRDVDNTDPAEDSLGAAVNLAAAGGEAPDTGAIATAVWSAVTRTLTDGIPADVDEQAIATAIIAALGTGTIVMVTPVSADGETVQIVQGDDYHASDGRALEWTGDLWPDLTSATIAFHIADADPFTAEGSVTDAGVGPQTVRVQLTAEQTAALNAGQHPFDVEATLESGRVVTLVRGYSHVLADVG